MRWVKNRQVKVKRILKVSELNKRDEMVEYQMIVEEWNAVK